MSQLRLSDAKNFTVDCNCRKIFQIFTKKEVNRGALLSFLTFPKFSER